MVIAVPSCTGIAEKKVRPGLAAHLRNSSWPFPDAKSSLFPMRNCCTFRLQTELGSYMYICLFTFSILSQFHPPTIQYIISSYSYLVLRYRFHPSRWHCRLLVFLYPTNWARIPRRRCYFKCPKSPPFTIVKPSSSNPPCHKYM